MNQEQRIEYFMSEIARLSNQVVDLQDERDALAAQVEALQTRISAAERVEAIFSKAPELSFDECKKLFTEEIRELRAEAVEQAVNETKKLESTPCGQWWYCLADDLKKCAERIRQEVLCEKL